MLRKTDELGFEIEELTDDSEQESQQKQIESATDIVTPGKCEYEPLNPPALNELFNGELEFALSLPFPKLAPGFSSSSEGRSAMTELNAVAEPLPTTPYVPQKCPRLASDEVYKALRNKRRKKENIAAYDPDYASSVHRLFKSEGDAFRRVTRLQAREQAKVATVTMNSKPQNK